jgi:hypothetical protein
MSMSAEVSGAPPTFHGGNWNGRRPQFKGRNCGDCVWIWWVFGECLLELGAYPDGGAVGL